GPLHDRRSAAAPFPRKHPADRSVASVGQPRERRAVADRRRPHADRLVHPVERSAGSLHAGIPPGASLMATGARTMRGVAGTRTLALPDQLLGIAGGAMILAAIV